MELKKKTQNDLLIVFGFNIFDKIIIFLGLVVLARLLRPEDFGILAVSEILISFIGMWNEHIFETSAIAISREDDFDLTVNIAFMTRTILSIFLYAIIYALSGFWSLFYNNPHLSSAVKILGLNVIVANLFFIPFTYLTKERKFDKFIIPTILRNPTIYGSAIIFALLGFGFWSLILSRVIGEVITVVSFSIVRPWKVKLVWDKKIFHLMFGYVKTMYLFMLLVLFITQIDRLVVSKILGIAMAGYYTMAYAFGNWALINVSAVVDRVAFPLYSAVKDDEDLLKSVYLKFFKYILFLSVPVLTCFTLFAEYFVAIFLGTKWFFIVTPLKVLCFAGFFGLIGNISNSLLKGISRLDVEVKRNLTLAAVLLVTLIPLTMKYGLIGSCAAVLISSALVQPIYFNYVLKIAKIKKGEIAASLAIMLGSTLCGVLFYIFCERIFIWGIKSTIYKFILSNSAYASAYLITAFLFMRDEFITDIKAFFKE